MTNWVSPALIASLLDEYSAALELFASQWTDSPEDCLQEAILKLTRLPQPPRNIAAWLFDVVRKQAISAHRSDSRRRHREQLAVRLMQMRSNQGTTPFDAEELTKSLHQLPDDEREIVVAKIWGNLSFADIAEMLGMSVTSTFRKYEAGLRSLRTFLESSCNPKDSNNPKTFPNCPTN